MLLIESEVARILGLPTIARRLGPNSLRTLRLTDRSTDRRGHPPTIRRAVGVRVEPWIPSPCSSGVRRSMHCEPMHQCTHPNHRAPAQPQPQPPHPPHSCDRCVTPYTSRDDCTCSAMYSAQLVVCVCDQCDLRIEWRTALHCGTAQRCGRCDAMRCDAQGRRSPPLSLSLCVQSTPLSPDQCSILVDWIAKTCMHTQQVTAQMGARTRTATATNHAAADIHSRAAVQDSWQCDVVCMRVRLCMCSP